VDNILNAQGNTFWIPFPISATDDMPWQPAIDGYQVLDSPLNLIIAGNFTSMPVILGTVRNETTSFVYGAVTDPISALEYEALVALWFEFDAEQVLSLYPPDAIDARSTVSMLTTDMIMGCPTRRAAEALSHNSPTYLFEFLHPPYADPMNNSSYCKNQVCHGADLGYVFHSSQFAGFPFHSPEESELSWSVLQYWTSFAHSSFGKTTSGTLLSWPLYNTTSDISLGLDIPLTYVSKYHKEQCDFWNSSYKKVKKQEMRKPT